MARARGRPLPVEQPRTDEAWRRSSSGRARRRRSRRRRQLAVVTVVVLVVVAIVVRERFETSDGFSLPSSSTLAGMSLRQRIVAIAESQVGYSTQPANSYCNKFSAYWDAGTANCPNGETSEEWCADFAAWAWKIAGVPIVYGYDPNEINGAVVSFYEWGLANGRWHPLSSGYVASAGDVAIYGLSRSTRSAVHAAIVTSDTREAKGPDVVNGDGDRTGFSDVEIGVDQVMAEADQRGSTLDGYVSPN